MTAGWGLRRVRALLTVALTLPGACLIGVGAADSAPAFATPSSTSATSVVPVPVGGPMLMGTVPVSVLPPGVPPPPVLEAASYLLANLDTGEVLVAKAPHARALPASTLKTLTALTVIPLLSPGVRYTAVPGDLIEGSKVGLSPGSPYTVQQLLQGMMLSSGNDAATGLARAAGGVPQTVARMQERARALGALDTVVKDPSGLDAPGQVTSAYDLALVARAALQLPALRVLAGTKRVRFPGKVELAKPRTSFEIQNHNSLLLNYPGAIGVKNGYTVAARWTVIAAATRGGTTYVVTALTRSDRSWRPTAALLDWAFTYGKQAQAIGRLVAPGEVDPGAATVVPVLAPGATVSPTPTQPVPPTAAGGVHEPVAAAAPARTALTGMLGDRAGRTRVGTAGLAAAALIVLVLALRVRARRRQTLRLRARRQRLG